MRFLVGALGLGMMLVFGLEAAWLFSDSRPVDGGAALIFCGGGALFFGAALLAAFLDWRERRQGRGFCLDAGG